MLLITLLALASSGLVFAQLPSTLNPVKAGFATEIRGDIGKIRILQNAGDYDVILHTPTSGNSQLSIFRRTVAVLSVKEGDAVLSSHIVNPPNQSTRVTLSSDAKNVLFSAWCNPRPVGPMTFYSVCSSYAADVSTGKVTRLFGVGDTPSQATSAFGGTIQKPVVSEIRGTPIKNGDRLYVAMVIKDQANVSYGGLYELKPNTPVGWQAVGLVADTTAGHYFITGEPVMSADGKRIVYNDSRASSSQTDDTIRTYDLSSKKIEVLLRSGDRIGSEILSGGFSNRVDPVNKFNFLTSTSGSGTIVKLSETGPQILYSSFSTKLEGKVISTMGMPTSNGIAALPYRVSPTTNWWEHAGIAVVNGGSLVSILTSGDVVNGSSITGVGDQVAPHACSVTGIDLDASSRLYRRLVTVFPVIITSLSAGPDGRTARMGGCGLNLEGTTLDSVTIGGATAEVVSRETDASTGQDIIVLKPLSPIYAGQTEVAVTINGRRFATTVAASGPSAPKIEVLHFGRGKKVPLAPNSLAVLIGQTGQGSLFGNPSGQTLMGGATVTVCEQPTLIFQNFGDKLSFLIPRELFGSGKNTCEVVLRVNGKDAGTAQIDIVEQAPGLFKVATKLRDDGTLDPASQVGAVYNLDGALIAGPSALVKTSYAHPSGVLVAYGTGFGPLFWNGKNEICSDLSGQPRMPPIKIGGTPATVLYCGAVEGYPGIYQINLIPSPGTEIDPSGDPKVSPLWVQEEWIEDLEYPLLFTAPPPETPEENGEIKEGSLVMRSAEMQSTIETNLIRYIFGLPCWQAGN